MNKLPKPKHIRLIDSKKFVKLCKKVRQSFKEEQEYRYKNEKSGLER
jgi:hypothetical protein